MAKTYTIREYDRFTCNKQTVNDTFLPESTFKSLEEFILANSGLASELPEFMGISIKKGVGKVITAKNYVGVISMNDGTTIEILPKISSSDDTEKAKKTSCQNVKNTKNRTV